jgi:selenocysteine lyase/cysteine desulfurase
MLMQAISMFRRTVRLTPGSTDQSALDVFAELRAREFARLDANGLVYLDYAGAALYPGSLVRRDARRLSARVLGNPHSESGPSRISTDAVETARRLTLRLLDADPANYDVVFTANATGPRPSPSVTAPGWCSPPTITTR